MLIISPTTIEQVREKFGIMPENKRILDDEYVLVTKKWVEEVFSPAFKHFLSATKNWLYAAEKNDCDDFSEDARYFARLLHRLSNKAFRKGLAFGIYTYNRDAGGGHAINFFITRDDNTNTYVIYFYEPQTQSIVELSQQERASCLDFLV